MATATYMTGRKMYNRPQALTWCDSYTMESGFYIPSGTEFQDFIVLSDHNRSEIKIGGNRIENRKRMINGTMRSYHIADKDTFSFSWEMLPSRSFDEAPNFNTTTGVAPSPYVRHTADGGAGGWDVVEWYANHNGPFYMLMSYDGGQAYGEVTAYTRVVHVYFSSFSSDVVKRGITDFWNISVELEEV